MEEWSNSKTEPPGLLQVWQNNSRSQWLVSDALPCTAAQPQCWDGGPMQQPEEPRLQGHIPTTISQLERSEHHRLQGLLLLSPCYWKLHYQRAGCTRAHNRHGSFPMEPKWIWKWAVKHGSTPEAWGVVLWICYSAVSISVRIKLITFSFELILTCKYNALLSFYPAPTQ